MAFKVKLLPAAALKPLAMLFAALFFHIFRYRHQVTLDNLAEAFPEKPPAERRRIAFQCYQHFALSIMEFFKLASYTPADLEQMIIVEDPESLQQLARSAKGTILVSGHFGNWELAIALLATRYWKGAAAVQKRQHNYLVDRYTIEARKRWGVEIIYSRGAVARGLSILAQNKILALLCDQDGGKNGVFVPFFKRMASTHKGAAALFLRSRANLIFGCCVRTGRLQYKGIALPIVYEGDFQMTPENITAVTEKFTTALEHYVRQYPEQYLWFHKRWKTQYYPLLEEIKT